MTDYITAAQIILAFNEVFISLLLEFQVEQIAAIYSFMAKMIIDVNKHNRVHC